MDEVTFGGADSSNAPTTSIAPPSVTNNKTSWKHIGGTRLEFHNTESIPYGRFECSVSSNASVSTSHPNVPSRLIAQRIVPWRHHAQQEESHLLLKANPNKQDDATANLDMTTIHAMLLSIKSAMVFQDAYDSCRSFRYAPRSLHTASLTEYHAPKTSVAKEKVLKKMTPKQRLSTTPMLNPEQEPTRTNSTSLTSVECEEEEKEPLVMIEAVEPAQLEQLYQACLEINEPTPPMFCQIVATSRLDKDILASTVANLLVSSFEIQRKHDRNHGNNNTTENNNPRLLPLQVGIRLALLQNDKFQKCHQQVTYKSAVSKKSRKKIKNQSPQTVLQEQVLNLLSLLAIRCSNSPVDFAKLVRELCIGVCPDFANVIFEYFELQEEEEDKEEEDEKKQDTSTRKERVPAVTPATNNNKTTVMNPFDPSLTLPAMQPEKKDPSRQSDDDSMSILKQKVSLTQSRSTRKNSLVPNQKRKYVGSHFASGLSNVSSLFRQVKVPKAPAAAVVPKRTTKPTIRLEPRRPGGLPPLKRPRTIAFERAKQVITETPAKKILYASPHDSFSPMPSNGQNARLVAQEALAAARRKL